MGAGYTGLWTAYYLLRRESVATGRGRRAGNRRLRCIRPQRRLVLSRLPGLAQSAARAVRHGHRARGLRAMVDTVDEIERVIAAEGIDAQWARGGTLRLARGEHQRPSIEGAYQTLQALGLADRYELLDAAQIADRVRVAGAVAALYPPLAPAFIRRGWPAVWRARWSGMAARSTSRRRSSITRRDRRRG